MKGRSLRRPLTERAKERSRALAGRSVLRGWPSLLFLFFLSTPLFVVSGYAPDGALFCTLYDLPKGCLIAAAGPLFCGLFCVALARNPEAAAQAGAFFRRALGFKLLFLLLILMALAGLAAPVKAAAGFTFGNFFLLTLLGLVLAGLFRRVALRWAAVYGLLAALVIFSVFGIVQFAGYRIPFLMPILGPASTLGYRNPAADFIALVLPFVFFAAWRQWRRRRADRGRGALLLVGALLLAAGAALALLFMNYSRAAILALLVEALVLSVWLFWRKAEGPDPGWRRRGLRALLAALLLTGLMLVLVMSFTQSRRRVMASFENLRRGGVARLLEFRYYHWGNTLMMIKENPVLGVGPGNWRFTYPLYYQSFAKDPLFNYKMQVRRAHNDYLQLAAECGIPALLVFLWLWGRQFYLLRYPEPTGDEADWRLPLLASLSAFSVIMFFSFPLQMAYSRMFCFFLLALGEARVWPELSK
ncbi:MAG TPA: O-antigen ligase family protein [Proteobacteria bacterium]|nr:O-antigen ligase family protein [Pseudomonadota bacterium]